MSKSYLENFGLLTGMEGSFVLADSTHHLGRPPKRYTTKRTKIYKCPKIKASANFQAWC